MRLERSSLLLKPLVADSSVSNCAGPGVPFLVTILMIPPVAPPPYSALAPDNTSIRSTLNGEMLSNWRDSPRELFWLTPSIITSTLRPRMFWP